MLFKKLFVSSYERNLLETQRIESFMMRGVLLIVVITAAVIAAYLGAVK